VYTRAAVLAVAAIAVLTVAAIALIACLWWPVPPPKSSLSVQRGGVWKKLEGNLNIDAGFAQQIQWEIDDLPADKVAEFMPPETPQWLEANPGDINKRSCKLNLNIPDPNTKLGEHTLKLRARVPSLAEPLESKLTIK